MERPRGHTVGREGAGEMPSVQRVEEGRGAPTSRHVFRRYDHNWSWAARL